MEKKTIDRLLRSLMKAQRERASLRRIGLMDAEQRAHNRVQAYRALVRDLRSTAPRASHRASTEGAS